MKKPMKIGIILLLLLQSCSGGNNNDNLVQDNASSENIQESISDQKDDEISDGLKIPIQDMVDNLLQEFPNGIFFNLLNNERVCLVEKVGVEIIRQMEKDFLAGEATQTKYEEYFKTCNIPPPPSPQIAGGPLENNTNLPPPKGNQEKPQGNIGIQGTELSSIQLSYLGAIRSLENNLGNIADPSIVETENGDLRVYFKNGNDPQAGISGFDNLIHSAISNDNGRTWKVESGVRVPVQSPIEALVIDGKVVAWGWKLSATGDALVRYESSDGINFQEVNIPKFVQAECKDLDGNSFGPLGDPTVTKLNDGTWIFHVQELVSPLGPFNRRACVATSNDGLIWVSQIDRIYGGDIDVTTNPAIKLNDQGILEWIWPTFDSMVYRKGTDSFNWSEPEFLPTGGDPDFLDLSNGKKLLAFGNFSTRNGGALIFTERVQTNYKITVVNTGPSPSPAKKWLVEGASVSDIKVFNVCLNIDLNNSPGASVEIKNVNNVLEVTAVDTNEQFANLQCVYILVGPQQIMG